MSPTALYVAQRGTAAILLPLVLGHVALILYAVGDGLSAGEILARTRGSTFWGLYYGLFVVAAAVHAAIGVRSVLGDWTRLSRTALDRVALGFGLLLLLLGSRALVGIL
ncbi:MAG: succinate dehydrogenase [Ectothiorhodospiraceae bacterium]|nr:succinate dehydrogenase [Ectothiorhodospiraceae bacterium]